MRIPFGVTVLCCALASFAHAQAPARTPRAPVDDGANATPRAALRIHRDPATGKNVGRPVDTTSVATGRKGPDYGRVRVESLPNGRRMLRPEGQIRPTSRIARTDDGHDVHTCTNEAHGHAGAE